MKQSAPRAHPRLGQHFLVSAPVLRKIIAAAKLAPGETILEIGPGSGALTLELARRSGRVVAIEKDRRLVAELGEKLHAAGVRNVTLVHGDILSTPLAELGLPDRFRVVANIPYYLTGRLIRRLLTAEHPPAEMLLMMQREVAKRVIAKPPHMNLLGLSVQAYGEPEVLFAVPPAAFCPPPGVDSAFIRIGNIGQEFFRRQRVSEKGLFELIRAAFAGKRKTLENSLAQGLGRPKGAILPVLARLGLAGKRPETLSLHDWVGVARALAH